jgi:hypothetical protein
MSKKPPKNKFEVPGALLETEAQTARAKSADEAAKDTKRRPPPPKKP